MAFNIGILLALAAMVFWGFGDFLIQKSVRKIGNMVSLFYITAFGAISLLPFVIGKFHLIFDNFSDFILLLSGSCILFIAAILDFEALKKGKLSVIEPLWSLEIVFASFMSFIVLNEVLDSIQIVTIISLLIGLVLVSLKEPDVFKRFFFEKGVFLGMLSAAMMGIANFFMGWMAKETDPLLAKWFFDIILVILALLIIIKKNEFRDIKRDYIRNKKVIWGMCLCDNIAWTAYAFAMALMPIAIATALSESYIIIAVLLGLYVNKERLKKHQIVGLIIAVISAVYLAYVTG